MFRIPHWILFVGVFSLWIRFKHFLELSGPVVGFCNTHTDEELDLYDDVVLFDIIFEGVFLDNFVIGSFGGFAELTGAIHPPPEMFGRGNNVIGDVIEALNKFSGGRSGGKIGMLIIGLNLEQGITLSIGGINGLVNKCLE